MSAAKMMLDGITDCDVLKRISSMYVIYFLLLYSVILLSYFILPDGVLKGWNPFVNALILSPDLHTAAVQIFIYNIIFLTILLIDGLLAMELPIFKGYYLPLSYFVLLIQIINYGIIIGTWSFEMASGTKPGIYAILARPFTGAGLLEFSAYILMSCVSFSITKWFSNTKTVVKARPWSDIRLNAVEWAIFALSFIMLFLGALKEAYSISTLTSW